MTKHCSKILRNAWWINISIKLTLLGNWKHVLPITRHLIKLSSMLWIESSNGVSFWKAIYFYDLLVGSNLKIIRIIHFWFQKIATASSSSMLTQRYLNYIIMISESTSTDPPLQFQHLNIGNAYREVICINFLNQLSVLFYYNNSQVLQRSIEAKNRVSSTLRYATQRFS